MKIGLGSPVNREGKTPAEKDHVVERDREKRVDARLMKPVDIEAGHDDGNGDTEHDHPRAECGTEPADEAMDAHVMGADQCGLRDEKDYPTRKSRGVNPEKQGTGHGGVEKVKVDGAAEAPHDKPSKHQRHAEVKIPTEKLLERAGRSCSTLCGNYRFDIGGVDEVHWISPFALVNCVLTLAHWRSGGRALELRLSKFCDPQSGVNVVEVHQAV